MPELTEIVGVAFGFAYVVLVIRQSLWCWPTGLANAIVFVVVFLQARFYGAMSLQIVYALLMLYGWREWRQGGAEGEALAVARTPARWSVGLAAVGLLLAAGFGWLLHVRTADALPFWDGAMTALSLVAQFMTTRKWIENWHLWIGVDTVYVGMYASQGLYPTAALYGAYVVLAVLGLREWRRSLSTPPVVDQEEA